MTKLLERLFSRSNSKKDAQKEQSRRATGDETPGATSFSEQESGPKSASQKAATHHRWQSWDYSDCVYEVDRHPLCRNMSRKLSDLQPCPAAGLAPGSPSAAVRPAAACVAEVQPLAPPVSG